MAVLELEDSALTLRVLLVGWVARESRVKDFVMLEKMLTVLDLGIPCCD